MFYDIYYGLVHDDNGPSYKVFAAPSKLSTATQTLTQKILDSKISLTKVK